jgi:hypothetical protein
MPVSIATVRRWGTPVRVWILKGDGLRMAHARRSGLIAAFLATAMAVQGCSSVDSLWSTLGGEDTPAAGGTQVEIAPSQGERAAQEPGNSAGGETFPIAPGGAAEAFAADPLPPFLSTGTTVSAKTANLRQELVQLRQQLGQQATQLDGLRANTVQTAQSYHGVVAAINARLQVGTTPGNPVLVSQWNEAQLELDRVSEQIGRMNQLANGVGAQSTVAAFLLDSVRATLGLSGAVEEDHRQLGILEDEVNKSVVLVERLLNELNADIQRATAYIAAERRDLQALSLAIANGEAFGRSLVNRAYVTAQEARMQSGGTAPVDLSALGATTRTPPPLDGLRPLVVIRFDQQNVNYEQALYTAVGQALERRADAVFDVVAVSPAAGSPAEMAMASTAAKRNAEAVLRSLTRLGLPAERIGLAARNSSEATGPEVHIYVR